MESEQWDVKLEEERPSRKLLQLSVWPKDVAVRHQRNGQNQEILKGYNQQVFLMDWVLG